MIEYKTIRSKRKSYALIIQDDGSLVIRAPLKASNAQIQAIVKEKSHWILEKQTQVQQRNAKNPPKTFTPGTPFLYLGKSYPLETRDNQKANLLLNKHFCLSKKALPNAELVFENWYRNQARLVFVERVELYAKQVGVKYKVVKISGAKKRWGSCSAKGNLNLSWRLVLAPLPIIDYVIVHELCHLIELNHSPAFWKQVQRVLPDYTERRNWLKDNGHRLRL
jgi:predicted metal-dependent hydrolase